MPTYEVCFLIKAMAKPGLVTTLRRTADSIFDKGGFIRKIDFLGKNPMPYRINMDTVTHKEANYFIYHFDMPPAKLAEFTDELNRDIDIIRNRTYLTNEKEDIECSLHEELLPPAYRPAVKVLLKKAEKQKAKQEKKKWKPNTGLDYYPFQR